MAPRRKPINGEGHSSLHGINRLVLSHLADRRIPGATVAVGIADRLVYNKGIGFAQNNFRVPMLPTHRTWSGSTGKMFTVAAVMRLHQSSNGFKVTDKMYAPGGLFDSHDFKDAIAAALASYPSGQAEIMRSWYNTIRVNHLLSHCGGFAGSGNRSQTANYFGVEPDEVTPRMNHLWFIRNRVLGARPEMVADYSNRSIGVMDDVIETVSGDSYKSFVRSNILDRLDLDHVASQDQAGGPRDSAPHKYVGADKAITPKPLAPLAGTGSAGGWRTTASDLVRLMMAFDRGGSEILSRGTSLLMEKPPYQVAGARGLGWKVKTKGAGKLLSHSGSSSSGGSSYIMRFTPGYVAGNGADLSNVTAAVTFNIKNSGAARSLLADIASLVGQAAVPTFYDLLGPGTQQFQRMG